MVMNLWKLFGSGGAKRPFYTRKSIKPVTRNNIEAEWRQINVLLNGKQPSQLRQALIKADKTLDNALRDLVIGETMGERLKNAYSLFERRLYDKIWKAHKMRNALVHESGYEPPHHMVNKSISDLKTALNKLGVTGL